MPEKKLRFGFHDFLNAQPLLAGLRNRSESARFELVLQSPSETAKSLHSGNLDLAMIPSIEYLKNADRYVLVPNISIASRGRVDTVLLVSKKPLNQIQTLALDNRSKTSVALLKILFASQFPLDIHFKVFAPDPDEMLKNHDAGLIIGDPALNLRTESFSFPTKIYDLSEEWFRQTGKTFIHAVVAVHKEITLTSNQQEAIHSAKKKSLFWLNNNLDSLARRYEISLPKCMDYLCQKIIYDFGDDELEGLTLFKDKGLAQNILSENKPIQFL